MKKSMPSFRERRMNPSALLAGDLGRGKASAEFLMRGIRSTDMTDETE